MENNDPFVGAYLDALQRQSRRIADNIASGRCESYSEYKEQVGLVNGLNQAYTIYLEAIKQAQKETE